MSNNVDAERATSEASPLMLHFRSVNKLELIVGDAADDRYETTLEEMADACRARENFETWKQQAEEVFGYVHDWCVNRESTIDGCYLAPGEGGVKLFVTTKGESYRFDFDDDGFALETDLHRIYPMCPVEVLQMPTASPDALQSFFSPENAFQIYGQPEPASDES